jgi:hypothetical protein
MMDAVWKDREQQAREAVRRAKRNITWLSSKEENCRFYRRHMAQQSIDWLIEAAREGDKEAIEFVREYARGVRQHPNLQVPASLHEFVWECFIDGLPKAKSGTGPRDTELHYQTIALLVKIVSKDYGFPEYRNVEHRGHNAGPMSACKLVAEELGLGERWIEEIWGERKASVGQ